MSAFETGVRWVTERRTEGSVCGHCFAAAAPLNSARTSWSSHLIDQLCSTASTTWRSATCIAHSV